MSTTIVEPNFFSVLHCNCYFPYNVVEYESNRPVHATCSAVSPPAVIFLWVPVPLMLLIAKEIVPRAARSVVAT